MPDENNDFEGLTPPQPVWVVDDWDRQRGRWLYPSQRQLELFRKKVIKVRMEREASERPL